MRTGLRHNSVLLFTKLFQYWKVINLANFQYPYLQGDKNVIYAIYNFLIILLSLVWNYIQHNFLYIKKQFADRTCVGILIFWLSQLPINKLEIYVYSLITQYMSIIDERINTNYTHGGFELLSKVILLIFDINSNILTFQRELRSQISTLF